MWFAAGNSTRIYLWLLALLRVVWSQDIIFPDDSLSISQTTKFDTSIEKPTSTVSHEGNGTTGVANSHCSAPPQPINGMWKISQDFCNETITNCTVAKDSLLEQGYELIYTCASSYRLNGDHIVYCRSKGQWTRIPECIEIRCGALTSVTRIAHCTRYRKIVSCDFPVLPWTQADLACRSGYKEDVILSGLQSSTVTCNEDGEWEPHPRTCIPAGILQLGWNRYNPNISTIGVPQVGWSPSVYTPNAPYTGVRTPGQPGLPQVSMDMVKYSCPAPRQPANGEWRLRQDICKEINATDCKVPESTKLGLSYELVYSCAAGYRANGDNVIYCRRNGEWSSNPSCIQITCNPLDTVSRVAQCVFASNPVNCAYPVLPWTTAELSCRPGYREDLAVLSRRRNKLTCNQNGEWEPNPLRCIPVCGQAAIHQTPFVIDGTVAPVGDFPWHVSLYKEMSRHTTEKSFRCGATLIHTNMLLTAAHCVCDEGSGMPEVPEKLFVMTGNFFRDYDDPRHNLNVVRKSAVKYIHVHHTYHGLPGNYASDIALLELEQPFTFSEILLPACLDTSGNSAPFLEPGVFGRIAGFGRTATSESSSILQTITVPYIPHNDCQTSEHAAKNEIFITNDKFCAGYTNGSAVCEGDSGGGLVFQKNGIWYVLGIVSVGLGVNVDNGEKTCEKYAYTLYTRVSKYMDWILTEIADTKEHWSNSNSRQPDKINPMPSPAARPTLPTESVNKATTTGRPTSVPTRPPPIPTQPPMIPEFPATPSNVALSSCLVPPQPTNGEWKVDASLCPEKLDCNVSQGTELPPGSQLIYECTSGYKIRGHSEVYCSRGGSWSALPTCVEISCSPLNSPARQSSCTRFGKLLNCDSVIRPETQAQVRCRSGYRPLENSITSVKCNSEGQWQPEPIACVPICGIVTTVRKPHLPNEGVARISEFPWHASIHQKMTTSQGTDKQFICGATLIQENLILTAAHCVYNERTKTVTNPKDLLVITGNTIRDFDSLMHNEKTVRKNTVKSVIINCRYYGLMGNYQFDIALIELETAFELSSTLLPACLDIEDNGLQTLDVGSVGMVPSFGTTAEDLSNSTLKIATLPYISYRECLSAVGTANKAEISADKFCAGFANDSTTCNGQDGGAGIVFKKQNTWFVMGIASVSIGIDTTGSGGTITCDRNFYSLYTKVTTYIGWIRKVIIDLEKFGSYPSCNAN